MLGKAKQWKERAQAKPDMYECQCRRVVERAYRGKRFPVICGSETQEPRGHTPYEKGPSHATAVRCSRMRLRSVKLGTRLVLSRTSPVIGDRSLRRSHFSTDLPAFAQGVSTLHLP